MGRKLEDLSGRRFGMLTAVEDTGERRNGYAVWRCTCDCGKEILVPSRHLKNGWAVSCGCRPRFGWNCSPATDSRENPGPGIPALEDANRTTTENQRTPEVAGQITPKTQGSHQAAARSGHAGKDWIGKRFGNLTVVAYDGREGGKHYWRCLCDCGKETQVCQSNLQSGHTRSCGCRVNPVRTRHFVEGTCLESIKSRKLFSNNTSGVRGVYRNKRTGRWSAQITFQGRTRYLGSFEELEDAVRARTKGEKIFQEFLEIYDVSGKVTELHAASCTTLHKKQSNKENCPGV